MSDREREHHGRSPGLVWSLCAVALVSVLAGCQTIQTQRTSIFLNSHPLRYCVAPNGNIYTVPITPQSRCATGDTEFPDRPTAENRAASIRAESAVQYCVTEAGLVRLVPANPQSRCTAGEEQFFVRMSAEARAAAIRLAQERPARTSVAAPEQPRPPQAVQAGPVQQTHPLPPTSSRPSISTPDGGRPPSRSSPEQPQGPQGSTPRASSLAPQNAQAPPPRAAPSPTRTSVSMGSSFAITADGVIVTNHHVIEDCLRPSRNPEVLIDGEWLVARILGFSQRDDLAVMRVNAQGKLLPYLPRSGRQMRLGEPVYAFGYPLADLLAEGGNFSQGLISAMAGLLNDPRHLQVSVPVQQGNSGGPLVDETGGFVGIVTSKLNAVRVAQFTGDIPQNVNFAVKSSVLVNLLETVRVSSSTAGSQAPQSPPEIAQRVSAATHKVRCRA